MLYQKPEMEIIEFTMRDIVCASTETNDADADESAANGEW